MSKQSLFMLVDSLVDDDLPDGAWMQMLRDIVSQFKVAHKVKGYTDDLVSDYLESRRE